MKDMVGVSWWICVYRIDFHPKHPSWGSHVPPLTSHGPDILASKHWIWASVSNAADGTRERQGTLIPIVLHVRWVNWSAPFPLKLRGGNITKPRKQRKEALERGATDYLRPEPRTLPFLWIEGWEEFQNSLAQATNCHEDSSLDVQGRWRLLQLLIPLKNGLNSL